VLPLLDQSPIAPGEKWYQAGGPPVLLAGDAFLVFPSGPDTCSRQRV